MIYVSNWNLNLLCSDY